MSILVLITFLCVGYLAYQRGQHRLWLQQRQWDREDREARIAYEQKIMEEALEWLNEAPTENYERGHWDWQSRARGLTGPRKAP